MARRGSATAESSGDVAADVADLAPDQSKFADPVRAETPEKETPPPPGAPPIPEPEPEPGPDDARRAAYQPQPQPSEGFDARGEIESLRQQLSIQAQRSALFERELAFRAAAQQQAQPSAPAAPQIDPVLQELIDILQVTDDDLLEVFAGGPKAAQIVTRALQTTALLAVNATEKRLVQYYNRDQQGRYQQQVVEARSQQMREAFWTNFPELADHEILVQHFASQVAAEQAQAPRFDWNSAQVEVARRTVEHLTQNYGVQISAPQAAAAAPPMGYRRPAPPLQQRLRPAFGEMGGGTSTRGTTPSGQQQLTAEILDLGLGH